MSRHLIRYFLSLSLLLAVVSASAQHRLPEGSYTLQPGALQIHSPYYTDTYIFGLGWSSGADLPDPFIVGQGVSVSAQLLALVTGEQAAPQPAARPSPFEPAQPGSSPPAFFQPDPAVPQLPLDSAAPQPPLAPGAPLAPWQSEPASARITDVRFGGSGEIRVVFDIPELNSISRISPLTTQGSRAAGEALELRLSGLLPPLRTHWSERGVSVDFTGDLIRIAPSGSAYSYNVFAIADPVRLVVDLVPGIGAFTAPLAPTVLAEPVPISQETVRQLSNGVTHHQFRYPTGQGSSPVHVVKVSPGAGQFRVVGSSRSPATLTDLARGSIVAINAGYFNTSTFDHIGLLRAAGNLDSLPTLGRASIGFNGGQIYIARTTAEVEVQIGFQNRVSAPVGQLGIEVYETAGQRAGDSSRGVLLVTGNQVTANRIGPLVVPENGFAIAYHPELRELALVEPGTNLSYDLRFNPSFFNDATAAVEAGPLLVDGGRAAFQPELEAFQRGQRILDDYTSQSAIGITPDGTVLLVVADNMRAQDLVPLMLSLGAGQAMRMDSGGSAAIYAGGSLLNRNVQRRIVSAIVLMPN